jgi:putative membrane protein
MPTDHVAQASTDARRQVSADPAVELSSRRTGMSFQRTRMSADRTLMSVIRTSLSMIGFGFTIFQFFSGLKQANVLAGIGHAPRNFGLALVVLGTGLLAFGIGYHVQFMLGLREERARLVAEGLVHGESAYPISLTLIVSILLLLVGLTATLSMIFDFGPFR